VVSQVVTRMEDIVASSRRIGDIIGVIDGIAFETDILALNAVVEAARAGEQGRGFAVVATEVRSLAQRSANAAREIKGLIGASVEKVEDGTRLVGEAGRSMDEIVPPRSVSSSWAAKPWSDVSDQRLTFSPAVPGVKRAHNNLAQKALDVLGGDSVSLVTAPKLVPCQSIRDRFEPLTLNRWPNAMGRVEPLALGHWVPVS